jgi:hypothetical protein
MNAPEPESYFENQEAVDRTEHKRGFHHLATNVDEGKKSFVLVEYDKNLNILVCFHLLDVFHVDK